MNRNIIWDEEASEFLKTAIQYIRKESPAGAKKVKSKILNTISLLPENPLIFEADRFKIDNDGSYRAFTVYHYRVNYKVTTTIIQIQSIRHTSQEPKKR